MAAQLPPAVDAFQQNWRFCTHCFSLWYNGYPTNGYCPAPDAPLINGRRTHAGPSWDFYLAADKANLIDGSGH